jgi:NAD(P)-dependent dehydrogenase (short-subunit alcohol dehydrogenase family)
MPRLENKVALITGAAKGIGQACAELFAREGATVIVSDIDDELGEKVCQSLPGKHHYQHLDVESENQWQLAMEMIQREFGSLDILVNNAGIIGFDETSGPHNPEYLDMDSWRKVQAVNSDSIAMGCKHGIQLMKHSAAASIINMSSRSGIVGIPAAAPYAASKAATRNHTKSVALYCAQQGYPIRCNSIHPGAILTPLWDAMLGEDKEAGIQGIAAGIPIGHMGEPSDVAYAALFLASNESKYITGIELNVDGGILAGSSAAPGKD